MKRAIALLLALVCLFSLGSVSAFAETEINLNDMEDEALLEVYRNAYSILVERGVIEKRRTIGIEGGGAFSFPVDFTDEEMEDLAFLLSIMLKENGNGKNEEEAEEVPSAPVKEENYFNIWDVEVVPASEWNWSEDLYGIDFKLTCLFPEGLKTPYPDSFALKYNYLDADGMIISEQSLYVDNLSYGDSAKASAFITGRSNEKLFAAGEVAAVKFVSCSTLGNIYENFPFPEPLIFDLTYDTNAVPGEAAPVEEDPNTVERSIVFDEPVRLYEDEKIGVELTSLYQEEYMGEMHKFISLKIHNKTDRSWIFSLDGFYLDGEETHHVMMDGNSGPDAGIKQQFRYMISYDNGREERPLDSLEQLLKADMKLYVDLFDEVEEYLVDDFFVRFSYDVTDLVP